MDIFALQDELARRIVNALQGRLTAEEQGRVGQIPTDNLEAYDYYLRGMEYFWRLTQEATVQARQMFEKAVTLDPQFALAYTWLGQTYLVEWVWLWDVDPQTIELAFNAAQKALSFDEALPAAYDLLGQVYVSKGQLEQGLAAGEQSLALDSNCARCYVDLAEILLLAGRPEEAVGLVEKAMRLDPQSAAYSSATLGWAYRLLGRYEEAIAAQKRALTRNPN
jgi:tetratricopeptide (TPR) repeat protein